jgi:tRNA 2-thiouridine synthesizing protein A
MNDTVDTRGLSCPQPVIMTLAALKKAQKGEITILVDTYTARENVLRSVESSKGWDVLRIENDGDTYRIVINKREG